MIILFSILVQLVFITALILFFYKLKSRFGLVPLYILLGSNQYLQTVFATSIRITFWNDLSISPGASILFCASLFTILLIYIKEGVVITQRLIFGIVITNIAFAVLATITNWQESVLKEIITYNGIAPDFFKVNYRIFIAGSIALVLDAFLIVIIYEFLFTKLKWLTQFSRLLIVMVLVFNFDVVVFVLGSFWNSPNLGNTLKSQLIVKTILAVYFAFVLYLFQRFWSNPGLPANKLFNADILSILTYQGKYEKLRTEKVINETQLNKIIQDKTKELEKSISRFSTLSRMRELRIDKFSIEELAREVLLKVKEAFEVDACSIHLINKDNLELLASTGFENNDLIKKLPIDNSNLNRIIQKQESITIDDSSKTPLFKNINPEERSFSYYSCAGSPLIQAGKCLGVIAIYAVHTKRVFSKLESEHLQIIAGQISNNLENTLLFEQNEKHKEVLVKQILNRKKIELAIKESEEKFRSLIDRASDNILVYQPDGSIINANISALKLWGYSKEEILQLNFSDLVHEVDVKEFSVEFEKINTVKNLITEKKIKAKDGSEYILEINTGLMPDGTLMAIARDLTERKKAEAEKQALLIRNLQTINTMLDGFILSDKHGQIIEANPAYCSMIGYSKEELLRKNVSELEFSIKAEDYDGHLKEMIQSKNLQFETKHRRKDNELIDLEVSISIMEFEEKPLIAAFVRDITERKRSAQKINAYNEQLRQLTAHLLSIREEERRRIGREIHDDLGQQLTAIKMDIAWIDKKTPEDAELIKTKIKNIIQLLDGSNQSVRRILSELRPSILDEFSLQHAMEVHGNQFTNNTGIPIEMNVVLTGKKLPEAVATCIFRVFQESLTNVTRYAAAQKVMISLKHANGHIEFSIEDNGSGFDKNILSQKKSFGLLGMRERVQSLNGRFKISSVIGTGTKINIRLPLIHD